MKGYKLILFFVVAITLCSCSTIRFGRSTTVTIETEHPGDVVDILAIGPKKAVDIQQVTLPYKYKVRHNNLPQRLDIVSDNYIYEPMTIGAKRKGELIGWVCRVLGWTELGGMWALMGGIGFACGSPEVGLAGLAAGVAIGGPLLAIGYTAETDIPDSKFYLTSSIPIDSTTIYQLEGWYLRQRALDDVYTLLSQGDYKLSMAKSAFLLESEPTAELYYLRGISWYYLGEHKKALKDLNESLYRLNAEINPGLKDEVLECISAVEQSIAIQKEKRNQMWSQIAGTVLQASADAYSMYQQNELAKYRQSNGMSHSGVIIDPNKLSNENLNRLIDPNFAIQQVLTKEMQEYQQFCRYNKKPDGSDYTLLEYRIMQGEAIQRAKENGYDILAEQRKQMDEDRKWRDEQRQKDKESWFARYVRKDYSYSRSSSTSSSRSSSTSSESLSTSVRNSSSSDYTKREISNRKEHKTIKDRDEPKLDSKEQYKTEPVSSEDYRKIKTIDIYYRSGDHAHKMIDNAELCKKGAYLYVKIGNRYYLRNSSNWSRFRNAILYGTTVLYFND